MMPQHEVRAIEPRKVTVYAIRAISYVLYFYLIAVEIILFIGFFLLLFGANPTAGFTQWAYRNLDRVMEPFRGIFTPIQLGTTTGDVAAVFETSVVFAMIIYGILALLLSALISWLSGRLGYLKNAELEAERRLAVEQAMAAAEAAAAETAAAKPTATAAATPAMAAAVPPPATPPVAGPDA